jgi:hypothetical protein
MGGTYNRDPEADVSFCESVAHKVILSGQEFLNLVKSVKYLMDGLLICRLGLSKPSPIHTVYRREMSTPVWVELIQRTATYY